MIPSSTSGRVKLNRTIFSKNSNALPKKRRSFSGNRCTLTTSVDNVDPMSVEEKITNSLEPAGINIRDENLKQELNHVNASPPKSTKVELQQSSEEDKESPGQAEGFSKGTEQPFDLNFQCGLKRRGTEPVQRITAFGDILERAGGPNTRSKSASGITSFKTCQLEKRKSERVKRHEKQVCCRLGFALCVVEEHPNETRVSSRSIQNQARSKAEHVLAGPGNARKRSKGKSSLGSAGQTRPIRGRGVRAKTRRSERPKRKRDSDAAYTSATVLRRPVGLATKSSSQTLVVKKEKADECGSGVWQQTEGGWHSGKVGQVRSSRRVVGTAEKDAKSSKCMTQRRRQSDRVTENRIYKVPARKPNTDAFHLNSQQIIQDYAGENNNKRLIKSPCCTTCCDIKYAPPRIYSWARFRSPKPRKATQAKSTNEQGLKTWKNHMKNNPFVNLCDIAKASIVFVDQLNSTYVLTEELKRNTVRCFKRHNGDLMPLDVRAGPCTSAEASQSQISLHRSQCATHRLVNEPPVVGVTETIGRQSHVVEKQAEKTLRLSGESIGDTAQDSNVLWGSDAPVQAGCSNAASTSCKSRPRSGTVLPFIPATVKNASSGKPVESENCKHKDGVQDVLMVVSEESLPSGQSYEDGEREDESEGPDSFSCQRTNPSQVWARTSCARTSCARTYISWPFCQRVASTKVWNVIATGAPALGLSTNTVSSVTLSDSLGSDSSVTDTPVSQNATLCCERTDSSPPQGEASDIQAGTELVRKSETNGSVAEKSPRLVNGSIESDQITFESGHRVLTIEAAEPQHGHISCSLEEGHPTEVVLEQGVSRVESQAREPDILWRQRPQQFRNPLKRCSSSVNRVENPNSPYPPALSRPLNGIMESSHFQSTWERRSTPAGLTQAEHLSTVSQTQNFRALLKVSTAFSQGSSEDDDSSMSSSDELVDEALASCGEIMCEIQDTCAGPRQEPPCFGSTAAEGGPFGEPIDLLKAYEQDAIVLDVIQDDPELFGNVFEERTVAAVVKSETHLVSRATCLVKKHNVPTNSKITWNSEISATGNYDIGQQDLKKRGRSFLPFLTDGKREHLCFDGGRPLLNGLAGDGFHMDGSFPAQKGTTERTQDSVSGWLWTDLETSIQGDAWRNSAKAGSLTSDETWDEGLEGDTMQANVIKGPSRQRAPWATGSSSDLSETSEKYCKYYFSEQSCCFRKVCWFLHLPRDGDERFCMDAVQRLCSVETLTHLQRAAAVFTGYYKKCPPGVHFAYRVLTALLSGLLGQGIVKVLLNVLRIMTPYKILPQVEFILAVFEYVSRWSLRVAIPDLINVTARSVEAGLELSVENFEYMQRRLELLLTPSNQMEVFLSVKYRALETPVALKSEMGELAIALTEVECCKEQQDWAKLGGVFCSMCTSDTSLAELNHLSGSIAMALLKETPPCSPLPFCQFVEAVCQGRSIGGLIKSLLGRIGVSLMFRYYKTQQWTKGKQLLDTLNALKVNYSLLKGLLAGESGVSRCRVLSMAAEVFLSCGSVESALTVLKDGEWTLCSPLWQCEEADVQHRQTVLYRLAEGTIQKDMFAETLEVLTKLPELQDRKVDNSQHNVVFHRHLKACVEKQSLAVASDMVELMFLRKIPVNEGLLRSLIHKLGKQNAWRSARSLFKSALSTGCYPRTQVNKYCRVLPVPYSLSEVEMRLAIEMFMVTNANDIQNPGFFPHALQIVLKRKRGTPSVRENDYHAASRLLLSAAQTLNPKLVIKYATVNLSQEQVFTLDSLSAFKWLAQNMNWASKDWLSSDSRPMTNTSPQPLSS